jgi:transposase
MTDKHQTETEKGYTVLRVEPYKDPDRLRRLYESEGLTHGEIAEQFGVCRSTITRWIDKHGIDTNEGTA